MNEQLLPIQLTYLITNMPIVFLAFPKQFH